MDQAEKLRILIKQQNSNIFSRKSFFFCSLTGGTGCSTIVYNIADNLAKDLNVLIVDYNVFSFSFANYLNLVSKNSFKNTFDNDSFENNIHNVKPNLDVFLLNMLTKIDNFDIIKNNLMKLDKFFSSKYHLVLFDLGVSFFLYDYNSFFDKLFFVTLSKYNDYNNLFRFFSANSNVEEKSNIIVNKYKSFFKIKDKYKSFKNKNKCTNDIYFVKYDKKFEKLNDFNDLFIYSSLVSKSLSLVVDNIKKRLIEEV